jgi:hypothetical protein
MESSQIEKRISSGISEFYDVLKLKTGGTDAANHILFEAKDPTRIPLYASLLGEITAEKFRSSFETLVSLDDNLSRDAIQAAEPPSIGDYMLRALHRRICSDTATSESLRKAIKTAADQGAKVTLPSSEQLAVGTATLVGVIIASTFSGPIAVAIAPLIGGVTLLLVQCGLDAFCVWAAGRSS